jgi:hypothetical protein
MIKSKRRFLLPAIVSAGSFLCLASFLLFTNPLQNLGFVIFLFVALFIFLVSLGYLLAYIKSPVITSRSRFRIIIFSFLCVAVLMFRSAQTLNFSDLLILLLLGFGLIFYTAKRTS